MANSEHCWALVGGDGGAHVYGSEDCHQTRAFPLAIQCKTSSETSHIAKTLQAIIDTLPHNADYMQILAAFNIPCVQTLLEDESGFYVIVIGSPPGIHHTA
ncbi:hypothetical protein F5J12DRAFT_783872 [Pisolithus orientalis]|uniref:uncharacterized protein n=1 Tax=Pisolithus orientalis TaxID=936130 RepID=UPI00222473E7|nr:uncharacterized protein F5J12DRAFT_783872 [Pisolithus orientalis]KAI6002397.1 hypothetical protein F5J12DRAFT_783872 [Pisolithus orientalis]